MAPKIRTLDGRILEGGGQLLRLSLSLAALTSNPIQITHIRGNRSGGGGLKAQHLACVNWLARACAAEVKGAEKGNSELVFEPAHAEGKSEHVYARKDGYWEAKVDIGSAGSTGLALQAVLPFVLFSPPREQDGSLSELPVRLKLSGGTNVSGSPSYEYITQVLLPVLEYIGLPRMTANLGKRGWSHGGTSIGNFTLEIRARKDLVLPAFALWPVNTAAKPTRPTRIDATFIAPAETHEHLRAVLEPALQSHFRIPYTEASCNLSLTLEDSKNPKRFYLILVATIPVSDGRTYKLGRDWLYNRKVTSPERTATELAERVAWDLYREWSSGAFADEFLRDQLVVFQALAKGASRVWGGLGDNREARQASLHTRTAEWVVNEMLGVSVHDDGYVEGVGFGGKGDVAEEHGLVEKMARLDVDRDR